MSMGPQEPTADNRAAARHLRDYYNALTAEGFTEGQALQIIGTVLAAAIAKGDG